MNISEAQTILNVIPPFTESLIKSAFRRAALKHHPDMGGDSWNFTRATEAKEVLMNNLNYHGRTYNYSYEKEERKSRAYEERQQEYARARKASEEERKRYEKALNAMKKFKRHLRANNIIEQTRNNAVRFQVDEDGLVYIILFGRTTKVPSVKNKEGWRRLKTEKVSKSLLKDLAHYIRTGAGWPKHFEEPGE